MKWVAKSILVFLFTMSLAIADGSAFNEIQKDLDSIIVKDLKNNKTIFKKNEDKLIRPASLTKIMTAILAIESGKMQDSVLITKPMTQVEPTVLGLQVGEKIKLSDLVHAALIKSANDAANSIAYYLGGGDRQRFIASMNAKAKKLGMKNTNFENPMGFDAPNHKTTASDLMKLTEYAINNKTFNSIVNLRSYSFNALNVNKKYYVYTSNKLERQNRYVVGVKTGYTNGAGPCLIARAKKDNKDILLVMLNAENRWQNAQKALSITIGDDSIKKQSLKAKNRMALARS